MAELLAGVCIGAGLAVIGIPTLIAILLALAVRKQDRAAQERVSQTTYPAEEIKA